MSVGVPVLVCGSIFQLGGRRRTRREGREGKKWEEKEREGENQGREGDRWRGGGKGNGDRGRRWTERKEKGG